MKHAEDLRRYMLPALLFLVFETIAIALWLAMDNLSIAMRIDASIAANA